MDRCRRWVVACCALCCLCAWPAYAKRLALVIGNDNYQQVGKLQKAGNDADAIARELQAAGFEVARYRDLEYKAMVKAFEGFYDRIKGGDEVAVFYAGHGVQTRTGSYLLPIDIDGDTESQVEKTSYSVNDILEELDKAKPQFSLIVIDACRDNPLRSRGRTIGATRGLTPPDVAKGQVVMFSAGRGQQALDSLNERDTNPNGVFTRELVTRMRRPGLSVDALGLEVRSSVELLAASVGHQQRPYIANESSGSFYFFSPTAATTAPLPQTPTTSDEAVREDRFWDDAKFAGNREGFEAYLDAYPKGRYASLARANLARLSAAAAAVASVTSPSSSGPTARLATPNAPTSAAAPATVASAPVVAPAPVPAPVTASSPSSLPAALPASPAAPEPASTRPPPVPAAPPPPASQAAPPKVATATMPVAASAPPPPAPAATVAAPVPTTPGRIDVTLPNGDRYDGEVKGNVLSGQGLYISVNGDRYEGGFVDNRFSGKGIQTLSTGDRYDGEFQRGVKHGRGVFRYANGDRYEGDFVENVFSGKGVLILIVGDRYEGEFRANAKNGLGIHYFASGERYEGEFVDGAQSGRGTHYYRNGDKYVGQFANGVRDGKGIYHFANGETRAMQFDKGVEKPN